MHLIKSLEDRNIWVSCQVLDGAFLTLFSSLSGDTALLGRLDGDFWLLGWAVEMMQVEES